MKDIPVILIAGVNKLGFIGNEDGDLICKCSRDLQHFKELSKNGVLIMGRKTYESLPKALPGRSVVVVTSQRELKDPAGTLPNQVLRVGDINNALEAALRLAELQGKDKVVIAGGTHIYQHFMLDAEEVHLTRFDDDTFGGARFPIESFDKLVAKDRLEQTDTYTFYDGEMQVTFESYVLTPCIEWCRNGLVKLRNGSRFVLSQLQSYVRTEDSIMLAMNGFGFHVLENEMNLDRLLKELDELMIESGEWVANELELAQGTANLKLVGEKA